MADIPAVIFEYKNNDVIIPCKGTTVYFNVTLFEEGHESTPISMDFYDRHVGFVLKGLQSDKVFYCQCGDNRKKILVEIKDSGM